MIRDYKFDSNINDGRRGRKGKKRLLLSAVIVLGGTLLALRFMPSSENDNTPAPIAAHETELTPSLDVSALTLPGQNTKHIAKPEPTPLAPPSKLTNKRSNLEKAKVTPNTKTAAQPSLLASENKQPQKPTPQVGAQKALSETPTARKQSMHAAWQTHKIASGESLSRIFKDQSLAPSVLYKIVNSSKQAKQLAKIRPGQTLKFLRDDDNKLAQLVLIKSPVESLHVRATENGFESELVSKNIEKRRATAAGTIQSSLFLDGVKAGLTDGQMIELSALFGWDIDFALDIRAGDQFRVLFEEQYLDGKKYRNGPILAAEFVNRGKVYQAVRFKDSKGNINYYDAQGHNKRRAFIRTPVKFTRISSKYNPKRMHPLLKKRRPHNGVDYAAPIGTPVKAAGAGKITFRGWKGGYGRVVIIQHSHKYQTRYAHMSKFASKAKAGHKVKQGQIIGYVGMSGLATGPHLHYEFRVNGVHHNPLTVKLPKSLPLPKRQLAAFKKQTAPLLTKLASIKPATMVASN